MTTSISELCGTFRGFAPTDESPIALGELEVTIMDSSVQLRHASGFRIDEAKFSTSELEAMSTEEIGGLYVEGSSAPTKLIGFKTDDGMKYIFSKDQEGEEVALLMRGNEAADILGLTLLYSPSQVEKGMYQEIVEHLRSHMGENCFPTLACGGKLE